jgi:hypothetical protein
MRRPKTGWTTIPGVRYALVALGFLLIALTPIVGPIPGPGGIFVFAAGLSLILKYTGWAKRLYVRFKRKHPVKGHWADWSLRRASARRRHERRKQAAAESAGPAAASLPEARPPAPADPGAAGPARRAQAGGHARAGKMDPLD